MTRPEQFNAIKKTIINFEDFIKNAEHSQPTTLSLIIEDNLSEDESEYIENLVQEFESFNVFNEDNNGIISIEQLKEMKSDLSYYLDTEVERNATDEMQNDDELFGKDLN